jgi:hypothetical protein
LSGFARLRLRRTSSTPRRCGLAFRAYGPTAPGRAFLASLRNATCTLPPEKAILDRRAVKISVLCPRNALASSSSVARHHANYGRLKSRTDNPQIIALFSPWPLRFCLASFPLCALCASVVKCSFSRPSAESASGDASHKMALFSLASPASL